MNRFQILKGEKPPAVHCQGADGPCESTDAIRYRQQTFYTPEEENWVTLCPECKEINDERWNDQWKDYYGDKL